MGGVVLLVVALVGLEVFARLALGLGDPPLMQRDAQIEYLHQPSTSYVRFGNRMRFNQWSMRSEDFPQRKADANEFRVLVMGDSVVHGGAHLDQAEIATSLLPIRLAERLGRPVVVGNASAGSWGPANLLAYARRFGFFEADVVVIVLSSHDATDVPTFGPLDVNFPERKPALALQEAVQRYLPRYLPAWLGGERGRVEEEPPAEQIAADEEAAMNALRELLELAKQSAARVIVAQHLEREEALRQPERGHEVIQRVAKEMGVETLQLGPALEAALRRGEEVYRDHIHPNAAGQRVLAEAIEGRVMGEESAR